MPPHELPDPKNSGRKVVLITGATGGIGKATAFALAQTGDYELALHYNAAGQDARSTVSMNIFTHTGIFPRFFQADLGSYDAVRKLYKDVIEVMGKVDVLFNNAGSTAGMSGVANLANVPIDVFEETYRVNAGSGILLTQLCLPHMEQQGWGRVVFCSSVAGLTGGVVGPHYASSKSAVHGFVHWLAGNVAKKGITVNAIAPALIEETAMLPGGNDGLAKKIPIGRLGRPEEIAETVMWMIKTGYVTNKVIAVDGGMYAY